MLIYIHTEERIEVRHRQVQEEHLAYVMIMEFERTWIYYVTYLKSQELCWKENEVFRNSGIEVCLGNLVKDQRQVLKIWVNYITVFYDLANRLQHMEVEPVEKVDIDQRLLHLAQ